MDTLLGRAWQLLNLNAISAGQVRGRHYAGIRCVNINQIVGSVGHTGDFDRYFHPMNDRQRNRWVSVAMARCQNVPMPAIRLVQIGDRYFVADGHHRLSVARSLRETAIDAEVTVWDVTGLLPWEQATARPVLRLARDTARGLLRVWLKRDEQGELTLPT